MAEEVEILEIRLEVDQLRKQGQQAAETLRNLRDRAKELRKENQEGSEEYQNVQENIRKVNKELRETNKIIDLNTKAQTAQVGAIEKLRAQLSLTTLQWTKLSKAERENTAEGQNLSSQIKAISDKLKEQEGAIGDSRRNVGDYVGALRQAGSWTRVLSQATGVSQANMDAFRHILEQSIKVQGAGTEGLKQFAKGFYTLAKAILSNPLFILAGIIAASYVAIKQWVDFIEQKAINAVTKWSEALQGNIDYQNDLVSIIKRRTDLLLRLQKAEGKDELEILETRRKALESDHKARLELQKELNQGIIDLEKKLGQETDEELRKKLQDQKDALFQQLQENKISLADYNTEVAILAAEEASIQNKKNEVIQKKHEERIKKQIELEKEYGRNYAQLQDELFAMQTEDDLKQIQAVNEKYDKLFQLAQTAGLNNAQLKLQEAELIRLQQAEIDAIILNEATITSEKIKEIEKKTTEYKLSEDQKKLQSVKDKYSAIIDAIDNSNIEEVEKDRLKNEALIAQAEDYKVTRIRLKEEEKAKLIEEDRKYQEFRFKQSELLLQSAATTSAQIKDLAQKGTAEYKALAITETIISTYASATAAFKAMAGVPYVGPILGAAASAAAIAAGLANVSQISKAKRGGVFAKRGAMIGSGDGYRMYEAGGNLHSAGGTMYRGSDGNNIEVERDEILTVLNRNSSAMLKRMSDLNQAGGGVSFMKRGGAYFQDGGAVAYRASSQVESRGSNLREMRELIEALPPQFVSVVEFEAVQNRLRIIEDKAVAG